MTEKRSKQSMTDIVRKNPWVLSTFIFGILAVVLVINSLGAGSTTGEDIGGKFVEFINSKGQTQIEFISAQEFGSDLYELTLLADGQEVPAHVTRDGKYFVQVLYPLDEDATAPTEQTPPQQQTPSSVDVPKTSKPKIELFVMSHCPYGTQAEKGYLPAVDLLGDKIDATIKFVNYAMHGEVEVKEQLNQHCIQEEQNDKFNAYLTCFLTEGNGESCLTEIGIDTTKMDACTAKTDTEFNVLANLEDESSWLNGRFPKFMIHNDLNLQYGVAGSPTFIVNGVKVDGQGRDPASFLSTICNAFDVAPAECSEVLTSASSSPGFGWSESNQGTAASCS